MNKIKVTHVGSLPRKQDVVDLIFARENEDQFDKAIFDRTMKKLFLKQSRNRYKPMLILLVMEKHQKLATQHM